MGKGQVQSIEPLASGGAMEVTTAVYLAPKNPSTSKKGIIPDVCAPGNASTRCYAESVSRNKRTPQGTGQLAHAAFTAFSPM
jgi:C-terminal processing protease CtpA/Prc